MRDRLARKDRTHSNPPVTSRSPGPGLQDWVSLSLTRLARLWRARLHSGTGEDSLDFYDAFFDSKDLQSGSRDHRKIIRQQTILAHLQENVPPGSRILEAGSGLGELLTVLPGHYRVTGMEYALRNLRITRRLSGQRAQVVQGTATQLPFRSETQDVCICLEVLEHIEDDASAVRELARVLKPGGVLIASVPYDYYWPQYRDLIGHFRHYTRSSFDRLLRAEGLETTRYLPNYPRWQRAYARRFVRVRLEAMILGRVFGSRDIYDYRRLWSAATAIQKVARNLTPIMQADQELNYDTMETSTFVVSRKLAKPSSRQAEKDCQESSSR